MSLWLNFEGIRCFATPQHAELRPITLLVGENSSGKSTFLALCQIASALVNGGVRELPFNEPPFVLGAFEQIASYRGGRAGRAKAFSIGLSLSDDGKDGALTAEFVSRMGQPVLQHFRLSHSDMEFVVGFEEGLPRSGHIRNGRDERSFRLPVDPVAGIATGTAALPNLYLTVLLATAQDAKSEFNRSVLETLGRLVGKLRSRLGARCYALAPIRTSPQRTYDPVSLEPKPEGSHVPMLLASVTQNGSSELWDQLNDYGASSGLFGSIEVMRKGKKESDPFQIGVRSGGPAVNLVDVGYGVSQVLPVIVDALKHPAETILLQQPEVHLHPRAQAELGSFFARLASPKKRFVIETHSDYLVDRIRREIRDKNIRPQDVSLLYFERDAHGATIHTIDLDKAGAILNPPSGYRQFFLDEERALLGF